LAAFSLILPRLWVDKKSTDYFHTFRLNPESELPMMELFKSKNKINQARILVVDDEPDLVSTIQCRLEWCHCQVITAANGKEGLEKAAQEKPDLILLDVDMPVMDGQEMLWRLREDPNLKDTPVIMCTAFCEADDIDKASAHGIADYVTKPIDFTDLMEKITSTLEKRSFK
jgi:CheY-like chemotaxis protein